MLFITHALPHNLRVDSVVQIGKHGAKEIHVVKPLVEDVRNP